MNSNKDALKMRVPGAKQAIDKMKYEIASEFGEITKRLVQNGLNHISGSYNTNQNY